MAKLLLKFKDSVLKEIPIDKSIITIGRKPTNDIPIDNIAVSGFHAKIFKEGDRFFIEDLNSLNGTFVNGKRVSKSVLNEGDNIVIGKHTLSFVSEVDDESETKIFTRRHLGDETVFIDTKAQKEILSKTEELRVSAQKGEVVGGVVVIKGSAERREYKLTDRVTTIGKAHDAGIRLKGLFTPKIAAIINRRREGYVISPSSKKLKINGKQLKERYELKDGDIIEIKGIKMQFYIMK